ncbi:signal transduction histidine kinase [Sphingomonas jejuensis]|uniref:histidine kinase n=2 Tax=Sphingomonas jejuensis TaxID=904715 RepID=A0ABX0XML8_9SPHN|nr:signal transduction histidine kinase [Sphingomonas jejuensis]
MAVVDPAAERGRGWLRRWPDGVLAVTAFALLVSVLFQPVGQLSRSLCVLAAGVLVLGRIVWALFFRPPGARSTGSLARRMIGIAAVWITVLLIGGGIGLDRILTSAITQNFDDQLDYVLTAMIASAEIGADGEVVLNRALGDQRFLEPYSGLYYQISGDGFEAFPSRSLWDRQLAVGPPHPEPTLYVYDSRQFPDEHLRIAERDVTLPGSPIKWRFQLAQTREGLDQQILTLRRTIVRSFALLGIGLILLAAFQTLYGLWPLRRVQAALKKMRSGEASRIEAAMPNEVQPMVDELNGLLMHNEQQAAEARTHAGNLAHALKTPLTVLMNAATANDPDLGQTVVREARTMRRQVDHHLARARAVGRRGSTHSRADVWPSLAAVERAVATLYPDARIDMTGDKTLAVRVERQDLDELIGNLVENAAKYGGGSVFVTVGQADGMATLAVEDDGLGIPEAERERIFDRGVRLDSGKPGTGLGLAIVRDVVEIYGGTVTLEESEDLGGLLVCMRLPLAA